MRKLLLGAALSLAIGGMAFATAPNPELIVTSGTTTTGILIGNAGSVTFNSANFAGWDITIIAGASNSPSLTPFGIDLTTLSAECISTCATLDVQLSDQNFTQIVPGLTQTYSGTLTGAASTTQMAWADDTNTDFGHGIPLGTLGPFTTSFAASKTTGVSLTSPYSLTIEDTFAGCNGSGCASYSTDADITGVPEPASVALFGGILALCASRLRRRKV
jgi:hypothetical protein